MPRLSHFRRRAWSGHATHRQRAVSRQRSGVILLVILGLLALFMLILVSFALTASTEKRGAIIASRAETPSDPPNALVNAAFLQILRGSTNQRSVIGPHSILEDIYGDREGIAGRVTSVSVGGSGTPSVSGGAATAAAVPLGGQLIEVGFSSFGYDRVEGTGDDVPQLEITPVYGATSTTYYPAQVEGFLAGRVLTIVDPASNLNNESTMIVRWFQLLSTSSSTPQFRAWIRPFNKSFSLSDITGKQFIINGRPFNGAGFGYSYANSAYRANSPLVGTPNPAPNTLRPTTGVIPRNFALLDRVMSSETIAYTSSTGGSARGEIALLPNPTNAIYRQYMHDRPRYVGDTLTPQQQIEGVDADEDYDMPDYQNLHMAWTTWNPLAQGLNGPGRWETRSPSFHRPELVQYWMLRAGGNAEIDWTSNRFDTYRRRVLLRPDPMLHFNDLDNSGTWSPGEPDFTGKIPTYVPSASAVAGTSLLPSQFDLRTGPWDVDNDNDGTPDSVWIDLGLPMQRTTDGKLVKPLVAVLCLDLDGRANLNAHGNPSHYRFVNPNQLKATAPPDQPIPSGSQQVVNTANMDYFDGTRTPLNLSTPYKPPALPGDEAVIVGSVLNGANVGNRATQLPEHLFARASNTAGLPGVPYAWYVPGSGTAGNSAIGYNGVPNDLAQTGSGAVTRPVIVPTGLGMSVAEINLGPLVGVPRQYQDTIGTTLISAERINVLRWLMEGRFELLGNITAPNPYSPVLSRPLSGQRPMIPGRYGEAVLVDTSRPGAQVSPPSSSTGAVQAGLIHSLPRAGMTSNSFFVDSTSTTLATIGDDNRPVAPMAKLGHDMLGITGSTNTSPKVFAGNAQLETMGLPPTVAGAHAFGLYSSPPDPNGRLVVGLDLLGRPLYGGQVLSQNATNILPWQNEAIDDPWEIDLSPKGQRALNIAFGGPGTPGGPTTPKLPATGAISGPPYAPPLVAGPPGTASGLTTRHGDYVTSLDQPFTPNELQALLRYRDADQRGTKRLQMLLWNTTGDSADYRNRFTTESWDIPCPNIDPTPEIRDGLLALGLPTTNLSFGQLVLGKLKAVRLAANASDATTATALMPIVRQMCDPRSQSLAINRNVPRLFAPALLQGLRMNLNRPLGNGFDDSTPPNGVIDEPSEVGNTTRERLWQNATGNSDPQFKAIANATFDSDCNGILSQESHGRQELAKHLYCLMMLVSDCRYEVPLTMDPSNGKSYEFNPVAGATQYKPLYDPAVPNVNIHFRHAIKAYRFAQWAINAVEYYDRDSIMTPFEFDIFPFGYPFDITNTQCGVTTRKATDAAGGYSGWQVDGLLSSATGSSSDDSQPWRGMAWGMEYPELLITETLAFHDKRVADTDFDDLDTVALNKKQTNRFTKQHSPAGLDVNFDQVRLPQGSCFVELYCTGRPNAQNTTDPAEVGKLSGLPRELYNVTNAIQMGAGQQSYGGVDLGKVVNGTPVWRLTMFTNPHYGRDLGQPTPREILYDAPPPGSTPGAASWYHPDTLMLDPLRPQVGPNPRYSYWNPIFNSAVANWGRFVYFAPLGSFTNPETTAAASQGTFALSAALPNGAILAPGQFAVVGPARPGRNNITQLGNTLGSPTNMGAYNASVAPGPANNSKWSPQIFNMNNYGASGMYFISGGPFASATVVAGSASPGSAPSHPASTQYSAGSPAVLQPLLLPCSGFKPGWYPYNIGFNISEPRPGYPTPSRLPKWISSVPEAGSNNAGDGFDMPYNEPFDEISNANNELQINTGGVNFFATQPGTWLDFHTIFLQRLADPTQAYNHETNPYRTVDWMSVDLTIFNGQMAWPPTGQTPAPPAGTNAPRTLPAAPVAQDPERFANGDTAWPSAGQQWPVSNGWTASVKPRNYVRTKNFDLLLSSRQRGPRVDVNHQTNNISGLNPKDGSGMYKPSASVYQDWYPLKTPGTGGTSPTAGLPHANAWQQAATRNNVPYNEAPIWAAMSDNPLPQINETLGTGITPLDGKQTGEQGFKHVVKNHTLGYANSTWGPRTPPNTDPYATPTPATPYRPLSDLSTTVASTARVASSSGGTTNPLNLYRGAPRQPHPWISWNNRPYANAMELLNVPASAAGRLGVEFSYRVAGNPRSATLSSLLYSSRYSTPELSLHSWIPVNNVSSATGAVEAARSTPLWANFYSLMPPRYWGTWTPVSVATTAQLVPTMMAHRAWPLNVDFQSGSALPEISHPYGHLLNFFGSSSLADTYAAEPKFGGQPGTNPRIQVNAQSNLHRLFEFVHVPSRFSGTEDLLVDNNLSSAPTTANGPATPFYPPFNRVSRYREPGKININTLFDRLATFNATNGVTSTDAAMFMAITNGFPTMPNVGVTNTPPSGGGGVPTGMQLIFGNGNATGHWADFWCNKLLAGNSSLAVSHQALRVLTPSNNPRTPATYVWNTNIFKQPSNLGLNNLQLMAQNMGVVEGQTAPPVLPTFFRPYRAYSGSMAVPIPDMLFADGKMPAGGGFPNNLPHTSASATAPPAIMRPYLFADANLLRRLDPTQTIADTNTTNPNPAFNLPATKPLFINDTGPTVVNDSTGAANSFPDYSYRDTNRNPYFAHQLLTKLGGMFTTRSNCYAVWITIGMFEGDRLTDNAVAGIPEYANTDGYRLRREAGSDAGNIQRMRAFMIVDRTLPVAFERGQTYNVEKCILLKRVIE